MVKKKYLERDLREGVESENEILARLDVFVFGVSVLVGILCEKYINGRGY